MPWCNDATRLYCHYTAHDSATEHSRSTPGLRTPLCSLALGHTRPHTRVLWVGLDDPSQALERLNDRLMAALTPLGFPPEGRPFHPHLTLARAQNRVPSSRLLPMLQTYQNRDFGEFLVIQIHLVQSQLQRGGALHTILRSVTLQS